MVSAFIVIVNHSSAVHKGSGSASSTTLFKPWCVPGVYQTFAEAPDLMASALSGSHSCWRDMLLLHCVWPQKSRLVWVYIWVCRWFHCCHFSTFGEIFLRNVMKCHCHCFWWFVVIEFTLKCRCVASYQIVILQSLPSSVLLFLAQAAIALTLSWGTGAIICNGTTPTSSTSDPSMGRLPAWAIVDSIERWVAVASKSPSTEAYWN